MPLFLPVDWESVSAAIGGQAGANAGWVFKSDGAGGGSMGLNTQTIPNRLTVGTDGDVDYNSVASAVSAAIAGSPSPTNPWVVVVNPGVYVEPAFTLVEGLTVTSSSSQNTGEVVIVAANPAADLITTTGGQLCGVALSGVTDSSYCLVRHASGLIVLFGISLTNCSSGVVVSAGASCIFINFSVLITGAGQGVDTAILVTGSGTYAAISGCSAIVPSAVLPGYVGNPLQSLIRVRAGAECAVSNLTANVAYNVNTADIIYADGGSYVNALNCDVQNCANAYHIGNVGSDTVISIQASAFANNNYNVVSDSATGAYFVTASTDVSARSLAAGTKLYGIVQYRSLDYARIIGDTYYQFSTEKDLNLAKYFYDKNTTGASSGGTVTAGTGLTVNVAAGEGYVRRSANADGFSVSWSAGSSLALTASSTNYVYYNSATSALVVGLAAPGDTGVLLATVVTDGSGIRFLHDTRNWVDKVENRLETYLLATRKTVMSSGIAVAQGTTTRKLDIGSGLYYLGLASVSYAGSGGDATWSYFYGTNGATEVASQTDLDITYYDNAGTLTAMTGSYYRSDTVYITSDGRISVIYGTAEYSTQPLAEAAALGNAPTFIEASAMILARVIVQQGSGIAVIIDERPRTGAVGGGAGGVSVHSALTGLNADDHTQYLLAAGTRSMSGNLNMGTNNISNVGTVDGVTVSAHASRHNPGGTDALATGTPIGVQVGATADAGTATSYAKSDHQHGISRAAPSTIGTTNSAGTASTVAGSDHVHDHGSQTTGSHHAAATAGSPGVNGFITGADQLKLNGIATGATNTPLASAAPANVTRSAAAVGVGTTAARDDHKHDISVAAPVSGAVAVGNSAASGSASTLAASDHQHAVARGTPVSVGTANSAGTGTNFASGDHVHSGLTRDANDFSTFTAKTTPALSDILIMEDSAAAGVKKQITVTNLLPVFGRDHQSAVSEGTSSTTSNVMQTKVTMTTGALTGTYRVVWNCEITTAAANTRHQCRLYNSTDATELCYDEHRPSLANLYKSVSGFALVTFTGAAKTFVVQYASQNGVTNVTIRRARIEIWRVS